MTDGYFMIYWLIKLLSTFIFRVFYNYRVYGSENIPKSGPYIICSNHCSFFDPVVICDAVPQRVYWVALKDLYKIFPFSIMLKMTKCIPVNGAIKEVIEALNEKKVIGIFIEGRRTYTGELMSRGRKGPAILAMRTGSPVVPAWIEGTYKAYPRRARFPRIHPIHIRFGKPMVFAVHKEEIIEETVVKETTDTIMQSIAELR